MAPLGHGWNIFWNYPPVIISRSPYDNLRPPFDIGKSPVITLGHQLLCGGLQLITRGLQLITPGHKLLCGGLQLMTGGLQVKKLIDILSVKVSIAQKWMPEDIGDGKSTLVQLLAAVIELTPTDSYLQSWEESHHVWPPRPPNSNHPPTRGPQWTAARTTQLSVGGWTSHVWS